MPEIISMINKARNEGYDVRANVYPTRPDRTTFAPSFRLGLTTEETRRCFERLRDPGTRARIRHDVLNGLPNWYDHYLAVGNWEGMQLVSLKNPKNKQFIGKRMSDVIAARGGDPVDVLCDLLLEEDGSVPTVFFHHAERDMEFAMKQPFVSIGPTDRRSVMTVSSRESTLTLVGTGRFRGCWAATFAKRI